MSQAETVSRLRRLADDWRKEERQLCEQLGNEIIPRSMRARRIKDTRAIDSAIEMIERMENMKAALRQHHKNAMGEGLDPSHPLTKLRVSAYQQTNLYANTIAPLAESK